MPDCYIGMCTSRLVTRFKESSVGASEAGILDEKPLESKAGSYLYEGCLGYDA